MGFGIIFLLFIFLVYFLPIILLTIAVALLIAILFAFTKNYRSPQNKIKPSTLKMLGSISLFLNLLMTPTGILAISMYHTLSNPTLQIYHSFIFLAPPLIIVKILSYYISVKALYMAFNTVTAVSTGAAEDNKQNPETTDIITK